MKELLAEYREKLMVMKTGWMTCDVDPIRDAVVKKEEELTENFVKALSACETVDFSDYEKNIIAISVRTHIKVTEEEMELSQNMINLLDEFLEDEGNFHENFIEKRKNLQEFINISQKTIETLHKIIEKVEKGQKNDEN